MQSKDGTGQRGHYPPKHVWVRSGDNAAPGIVLDWRVVDGGRWEAFVLWAEGGGEDQARAHLEWVDQARVRPRE